MTPPVNTFRSSWIYFSLLLFAAIEFYCFSYRYGSEKLQIAIAIFPVLFAALLAWLFLQHTNRVSMYAFPIYTVLILGVGTRPMGLYLYDYFFFFVVLLFLPVIMMNYLLKVRQKYVPGSGAILVMVLGFMVSVIYQTINNHGVYEFRVNHDVNLFLAIAVFYMVYALLSFGILSLRHLVMTLACASSTLIVYIMLSYLFQGNLMDIATERFGDTFVSPNQTSAWLDLCFPLALFLAIHEQKKRVKIFFTVLSVVYGLVLLLCSSRGSFIGLVAVPVYFIIRSRSIKIWILISAISIGSLGLFGGKLIRRVFEPDRRDLVSTMGRLYMIKAGNEMLKKQHFFFGIGMDNFMTEKFKYGFPSGLDRKAAMSSHNTFLEFWFGWGLLGVVGWVSLLVGSIIRTARARLPAEIAYLKPAFILSLFCFAVHSFFDSTIGYFSFLVLPFLLFACMFFLGSTYGYARPEEHKQKSNTGQLAV
jgi:hypothetical protein